MNALRRDDDTICAISTAPGVGGIAVIRLSGLQSINIGRKVAPFLPAAPESHRVYFGNLIDSNGDAFDEAVVTYFARGKSFTSEETLEFSYHGSPAIGQKLLKQLITNGARIAQPGEFTSRAFFAGRIDLVQAESVLALIESQSETAARLALRQLKGELSQKLKLIEDEMTLVLAHLEASIDFSAEDIELSDLPALARRLSAVTNEVLNLINSYTQGRRVRDGLRVALVGEPNVGKSSLLNTLLGEERAIVTPIAGTTRDLVEGQLHMSGWQVTLVDTAGLRETNDLIEKMGIARTFQAIEQADLVLRVVDASEKIPGFDLDEKQSGKTIYIGNKADLHPGAAAPASNFPFFLVSAKTGLGIGELKTFLDKKMNELCDSTSTVVMQARHFELLNKSLANLQRGEKMLRAEESPEFIVAEIQEALLAIFEILGKRFDDQVMDRVFSEFCLGK
jgi:tRNA modification GTPase